MDKKNKQDLLLRELWQIRNPHLDFDEQLFKGFKKKMLSVLSKEKSGSSPVSHKALYEITTARNRDLISINEQNILRTSVVAFFGMSVGSHAAITWEMTSRAEAIKICDPDTVSGTNLNRLRTSLENVSEKKVDLVSNELRNMNPYLSVYSSLDTSEKSIESMLIKSPKVNAIVDEIDDFMGKVYLRKIAKKHKLPLLSAADVGDMVVLDIERYDVDESVQPFLGRIEHPENIDFDSLSSFEKRKLIIKLVGFEKNSYKMLRSLFAIGGSIVSWPQLGSTAVIAGGIIAATLKKVLLSEKVLSGRYYFSLDDLLVSGNNKHSEQGKRDNLVKDLEYLLNKL